MPCQQCADGKWRWGDSGECVYDSREECERDNENEAAGLRVEADRLAAPRYFQSMAEEVWAVRSPAVLRELAAIAQRQGEVDAVHRRRGQRAEDAMHVRLRDGVAVLPVVGPIFPRANLFTEMSGATSVSVLALDLQRMAERTDIKAILLDVDSPGGAVTGIDEMAGIIAEVARRKPVVAYVGGMAASAAYWLASAAGEIVLTRTGQVGSIGVLATVAKQMHPDLHGFLDFDIVSSHAPDKRPDPETDEGRAAVLEHIDAIEALFIDAVAEGRGVDRQTVIERFGGGRIVVGGAAVRRGMADRIGTFEQVLAELQQQPAASGAATAAAPPSPRAEEGEMSEQGTTTAAAAAASAETVADEAAPVAAAYPNAAAALRAEGARAERERILGIEEQAGGFAGTEDLVRKAKADGETTPEAAAAAVLAAQRQKGAAVLQRLRGDEAAASEPLDAEAPEAEHAAEAADPADDLEAQAKAEWERKPELRREFGSFERFAAFKRAAASGRVRILHADKQPA